jgi:hypothetical protein
MPCPVGEELEAKLESLREDLELYHPKNGMSSLPAKQARQVYEQMQSRIIWLNILFTLIVGAAKFVIRCNPVMGSFGGFSN